MTNEQKMCLKKSKIALKAFSFLQKGKTPKHSAGARSWLPNRLYLEFLSSIFHLKIYKQHGMVVENIKALYFNTNNKLCVKIYGQIIGLITFPVFLSTSCLKFTSSHCISLLVSKQWLTKTALHNTILNCT